MSAPLQSQETIEAVGQTTKESAPRALGRRSLKLVVADFARMLWLGLCRFVGEALEEHGKLYEKNPYGWWI